MERLERWSDLQSWGETFHGRRHVFRGQGSTEWPLATALARHFRAAVGLNPHHWRDRELKIYQMFRERLLRICPGFCEEWEPKDILALMQHHHVPTRMLDFTYSPFVAAFFALRNACGDSAIWVIDSKQLGNHSQAGDYSKCPGPTHVGGYQKELDQPEGAVVVEPRPCHPRVAAQQSCFLVPGHISRDIDKTLTVEKVTLSEGMVFESLLNLHGRGIYHEALFPDLDALGREVTRFATTGSPHFVGTQPG